MTDQANKRTTTRQVPKDTQIEELTRLVKNSQEQIKRLQEQADDNEPRSRRESVRQDDYIEVISLCPNMLTMTTEAKGMGFPYTWVKFGDISQIVYSDLQLLIKNHGSGLYTDFFREGYVYINDKDVVKKSGFNEIYEELLDFEQMQEVLKCDSEKCTKLLESTNHTQQLFIARMIIERIINGEKLDLNIIDKFARISGVKIIEEAEYSGSYRNMPPVP